MNRTLLKENPTPLYVQLREILRRKIKSGDFPPNTFIPSEQEIGKTYGVSRITVREALSDLIGEGLLARVPGKGTFVANQQEREGEVGPPIKRTKYRKLHTIGIVSPVEPADESSLYYGRIIRGLKEALSSDYNLWLVGAEEDKSLDYIQIWYETKVDGMVIIAPPFQHRDSLIALRKKKVPFIIVGASFKDAPLNFIDTDNVGGAFKITEYLLKSGHRKIGLISGSLDTVNSYDRLAGYRTALKNNGIKYDRNLVVETHPEYYENSYNAAEKLLKLPQPPTAIFAAGHRLVLGTVKKIREDGLRIPEDISLAGFDEMLLDFPLTTVKQPTFEMGRLAGRELTKNLRGNDIKPVQTVFDTEMVIGKSCREI